MDYFITDSEGKDYLGRQWGEGRGHRESNDNYYFVTYPDPHVALFMNPIYDGYDKPRLWESVGVGKVPGNDFRSAWTELATVREVGVAPPTDAQCVTFGIVCALNVVSHPEFVAWALGWLSGRDRSKETAARVSERMLQLVLTADVAGAHAAVHAAHDEPRMYGACAAHRAWYTADPLDLAQIALVVMTFTPEEIGTMLGDEDGASQPGAAGAADAPAVCDPADEGQREAHDDHDGTADVGLGRVLPGSEGESPGSPEVG